MSNNSGQVFTLIAYQPNGVDTCRGCVMSTSDSDMVICTQFAEDDIVADWVKLVQADSANEDLQWLPAWNVTLLINGLAESTVLASGENPYQAIYGAVQAKVDQLLKPTL